MLKGSGVGRDLFTFTKGTSSMEKITPLNKRLIMTITLCFLIGMLIGAMIEALNDGDGLGVGISIFLIFIWVVVATTRAFTGVEAF